MNNKISEINPMLDAYAVSQLILRERQCRDRGWWDKWMECYAKDSIVDISWFKGTGSEFIEQTRLHFMQGRHRLSPPIVQLNGDRACVEVPLAVEFRILVGNVEADLTSYLRSQYRAKRIDGVWRIVRLIAIYERDMLTPSIPGTTLHINNEELIQYRPSYRFVSWYTNSRGIKPQKGLLGEDEPEQITQFYNEELTWLENDNK